MDTGFKLHSVFWYEGMLLRPEHFTAQEQFLTSQVLWTIQHLIPGTGLIGAGPRYDWGRNAAQSWDPDVQWYQAEGCYKLSISRCRGVTRGGIWVDIPPEEPLSLDIDAEVLPATSGGTIPIYILADPLNLAQGPPLEAPPEDEAPEDDTFSARPPYTAMFEIDARRAPYALLVGQLVRNGNRVQLDTTFIPPCMFMLAHTALVEGHHAIVDRIQNLLIRFMKLYRAILDFAVDARRYQIESLLGADQLTFVGRMVVALQGCLYDIADPAMSPKAFFTALRKLMFATGVYMDGSIAMEDHLADMEEHLRSGYYMPLSEEIGREGFLHNWVMPDNLRFELESHTRALQQLDNLEKSLQPIYTDYRFNVSLASVPWVKLDGVLHVQEDKFRKTHQASDGAALIVFRNLEMGANQDDFRLFLMMDPSAPRARSVSVDLIYNDVVDRPVSASCTQSDPEQFNFAIDLKPPQGQPVRELVVRFPVSTPILGAVIHRRIFLGARRNEDRFQPLRPENSEPRPDTGRGERSRPEPPQQQQPPRGAARQPSWGVLRPGRQQQQGNASWRPDERLSPGYSPPAAKPEEDARRKDSPKTGGDREFLSKD